MGAGIAGLACAQELINAGVSVQVRERARTVGGRMATRHLGGRAVDTGAAYFTVSDPDFAHVVDRWRDAGLVRAWTNTFASYGSTGRETAVGPMRWAAPGGLRSLAAELAHGLPVITEASVRHVEPGPQVDGKPVTAVVLALPGPQAIELLDPALQAASRVALAQRWVPTLTGVFQFARRGWSDFSGAFVNDHPVLTFICDDGDRRGDAAPVLLAHTTAAFAERHLAQPEAAAQPIEQAIRDLLDLPEAAVGRFVCPWCNARPEATRGVGAYHLDADGIGLAGDAFGNPRVETAWLSGRALGRALAERLGPSNG